MPQHEKIKQRIRKLLNLAANDAAAEGEIENALVFAQRLMDEHHLDEADLKEDPTEHPFKSMTSVYIQGGSGKLYTWEAWLSGAIVKLVGTIGEYQAGRQLKRSTLGFADTEGKRVSSLCYYGPAEDVAIAVELWNVFRPTIATMAVARHGGCYRGAGRSYAEGFADGLWQQVATQVRRERTAKCTALVIRKNELANRWLEEDQGIKLSKGRSYDGAGGNYNHDAFAQGKVDGASTEFSANRKKKLGNQRKLGVI